MNINQLRSKYKKEIQIIREKVESKNLFISLGGIDEIIKIFEELNIKEHNEIQDTLLEKLLDYTARLCEDDDARLINEKHIIQAIIDLKKKEIEIPKSIQLNNEKQKQEIEQSQGLEEVNYPKKSMNIIQVRTKYKNVIEKIREKIHGKSLFINLSSIDEIIISLEKLNLKERSEIQDRYIERLLDSAIIFCESHDERLINETHIKQALLDVNRTEVEFMKKILPIKKDELSELEIQVEEVELSQEIAEVRTLEEQHKEFEFMEKKEVLSTLEEIPSGDEILNEEIVIDTPEKETEEIIPPKPKLIDCPFCGSVREETATFCPQCGMIFKKY